MSAANTGHRDHSLTRVFLIRHGQSTFNAAGRFQGCCDEPVLTVKGVQTADAAGRYLRDAGLHAVITSPLRRAAQTAEEIYEHLRRDHSQPPSFETERELREIELPLWEGKPLASVAREHGEQYRAWKDRPHLFRMGERLPVADLFERAARLWPRLLHRFRGQNILLVTHGGTARALVGTAIGIPQERFHSLQQSNGGLTLVEFPGGDFSRATLAAANATDYLEERLPKLKDTKTGLRVLVIAAGNGSFEQHQRTAALLNEVRLDAVFAGSPTALDTASSLLRHGSHSNAQIHTSETLPVLNVPDESLGRILWVIEAARFRQTLGDVLSLGPAGASRLHAVPLALTALHQAAAGHPPVLQAMNLHDLHRFSPRLAS